MATIETRQTRQTVFVDTFTDGLLGPDVPMLGPVADGGHIVVNTTPGCWGPMITPSIRGGHEVCSPVAVKDAASATRSRSGSATSRSPRWPPRPATTRRWRALNGDRTARPSARSAAPSGRRRASRASAGSMRCANCGADATPFTFTNGYTIAFDPTHTVGVTVGGETAEAFATTRRGWPRYPTTRARTRSCCSRPRHCRDGHAPSAVHGPARHDAVDDDAGLARRRRLRRSWSARTRFALTPPELTEHKTDGHIDIDAVRPGAFLVCPVKVEGGGVYLGDMHALQGDGEIAGHTCDVSGTVTLEVEVVKGLAIDGPVLFPVPRTCRTSHAR